MSRQQLRAEQLESRFLPSTYYLHQGGNLQSTIDIAQPGDSIFLDAGATFMGPITLRAKSQPLNKQWITIGTNLFPLPAGVRAGPSDASSMAEILAPGSALPAIATQPGASCYTLRGLNILPVNVSALVDTLVTIGDGSSNQATISNLPNNIVIDQCFIHGLDGQGIKRGVALNDGGSGSTSGVYNSYVSNFKLQGQDSQAIEGWNGTGPYTIQNDYLEGAGENVLFGGAYSYIQQVPSNITISGNTFSKPLSWNPNDPSFAGIKYSVKNLFELKNAQNVTIDNNTFQNNWVGSQDGHAILFTPRGLENGGPWVTVSNVRFTHNVVQNTAQGFNILGSDDLSVSQVTTNILIQDTVFNNVGGQVFTLQTGRNGGTRNLTIDHITISKAYTDVLVSGVHYGFQFTNNLMPQGTYGMIVDTLGLGPAALAQAFPDGVITNNVIVGGMASLYPPGNFFPATFTQALLLYPWAGARNVSVAGATTTAVSSSANPSIFGQSVTFTATVSSNGPGSPTGTVSFSDGSAKIGQATLSSASGMATATVSTSSLALGTHTITASYSGDANFASSTGTLPGGQRVNNSFSAPTTTVVSSSANPSVFGKPVTFTATVKANGFGNPTGTVTFFDGSSSLGQGTLRSSFGGPITAGFTTSSLAAGNHTITATYGGDNIFQGSTGTLTQTVSNGSTATTTAVSSSANPSVFGQPVTFTATVSSNGQGNPTGTVSFLDGSTALGQGTLSSSGGTTTASFSTSSLTAGTHTITASYAGDGTFQSSTGTLTQTVSSGSTSTTTAVSSSANPSIFGQPVTFTATVSSNGPGNPTGTVSFFDNGTSIGQGTLGTSGGVTTATFSTSSLAVGTHPITATYNGDGSFSSSTGTLTGGQVVNPISAVGSNVTATLNFAGLLTITGDTGNNAITITQVSPGVLQITGVGTLVNQSSNPANFSSVTGINISLLKGNDSVTMNNFSISGNISIIAGSGSDTFALATITANVIGISATGPDMVSVNSVTARNDLNITVGAGTQSVAVKGTSCLDLTIRADSATGDNTNFDLENDTVTKPNGGGLTLDDSRGAGNDTVTLSHLNVAYQVSVVLSSGSNTVSADHVTALFGSINGGSGGNNHYFDKGGNSGYAVFNFLGH